MVNELDFNGATDQTEVLLLLDEGCHPSPAACSTIHHQPSDFKVKELCARKQEAFLSDFATPFSHE